MIDLSENTLKIKEFLNSSIHRFQEENNNPNSIGVYCNHRSGWITTNFNINKSIAITKNNCPDFEFVEFDFLELPEWEVEYEADIPEYKLNGVFVKHDHNLGDEHLNQMIFEYLKFIVVELKKNYRFNFLLQILDSDKTEVL